MTRELFKSDSCPHFSLGATINNPPFDDNSVSRGRKREEESTQLFSGARNFSFQKKSSPRDIFGLPAIEIFTRFFSDPYLQWDSRVPSSFFLWRGERHSHLLLMDLLTKPQKLPNLPSSIPKSWKSKVCANGREC